jgi:molybdopterin-guanine dinucleotide biosynthesis protein A
MREPATLGLLLAGGQARRMGGGDKALALVGGVTLLRRCADALAEQCAGLAISANGDPARFSAFDVPVIADEVPGFAGPLAGVLAGLDYCARARPEVAWVLSAPTDCPFLPGDLVARLHAARAAQGARLACAASGARRHPAIALWPVDLREALRHALIVQDMRKVGAFLARHTVATARWETTPHDPFFNANTPDELAEANRIAASVEPHALMRG